MKRYRSITFCLNHEINATTLVAIIVVNFVIIVIIAIFAIITR